MSSVPDSSFVERVAVSVVQIAGSTGSAGRLESAGHEPLTLVGPRLIDEPVELEDPVEPVELLVAVLPWELVEVEPLDDVPPVWELVLPFEAVPVGEL